jgi:competence protein ComEA
MERFFASSKPIAGYLKRKLKKYRIEVVLILISIIVVIISLLIFFKTGNGQAELDDVVIEDEVVTVAKRFYIDISGGVEKPDVYEVVPGTRLKDVLVMAGGLSVDADRAYFSRNYNLARLVGDQEKVYVPFTWETNSGIFVDNPKILDYTKPQIIEYQDIDVSQNDLISINTANLTVLDQLPGIGKVTAEKIINNRPYSSIDDLLNRKIVNKSIFEQIKNMISL